jgi:hypothetical protein
VEPSNYAVTREQSNFRKNAEMGKLVSLDRNVDCLNIAKGRRGVGRQEKKRIKAFFSFLMQIVKMTRVSEILLGRIILHG